jgi:hypothetical protein
MALCKLCKINEADKTGSHIVPHFLLKRIDNEKGVSSRDKQLGFSIGEFETTSYVGRSVLPEKLNEVFGELSDEEIKKNNNPLVLDNIFCSECELRISQIENEYAKTLNIKESNSSIRPEFASLFWISVLWRISISKNQGLILKSQEEEKLRRILNTHLKLQINDIDLNTLKNDTDCTGLVYRLIRCPDYSSTEATYLFCHPSHKMPYSLIIDEYTLLFYLKKGHVDNLIQYFFGFEKGLKGKPVNDFSSGETKILYDNGSYKARMNSLLEFIVKKRIDSYNWIFDEIHKRLGGRGNEMPVELKQSILRRITTDEKKLGRRYTYDDLTKTMYEEIKKYSP